MSDPTVYYLIAWTVGVEALLVLALLRHGAVAQAAVVGAVIMLVGLVMAPLVLSPVRSASGIIQPDPAVAEEVTGAR